MAKAASPADASAAQPLQWPLVGRHEELDQFSATLADERAHGFVIHGPAGVGKTRLGDQCLALADRAGRNVARATATEGSRPVPLGALAHLLPAGIADERGDLVAVVHEVRRVLDAQAAHGPLVLFVDDLQLLDATSAALVVQLVDADLLFLVATVRTGAAVPPGVDSLWHRARVRRIDLEDLDRTAVDTLLHLVLGGPVEAATVTEIWTASQGNVLFVRELVLGAFDSHHLVEQRGVWRLVAPLVTTPRLYELVAARLGALEPSATNALDILAVWEPASLSTLEAMVGIDELELLDRAGLFAVRTDGRRQLVTLAHPLYGEILRARMPALTRRRHLLDQADRIDAHGGRRREDAIRVATARLEASGSADPALLARAARLARYGHDFIQVERLGRAAMLHGMTPELGLLVGEALHELGAFGEADDVLTAAEASTTDLDDELLVQITEIRTRNLMWGLLRHGEALDVNRRARERLGSRPAADELTLNEAMLLTYSGRPRDALAVLDGVGELADRRGRALRSLAEVPALIGAGRCDTAFDAATRAFAEQMQLPNQVAIPGPDIQVINQMWALAESGRLAEAGALAAAAYEATPTNAPPEALMWLAHQQGRCALLLGRLETARRWLGEALARCEEHGITGPRRLVLSALAAAHAGLGDADAAGGAVAEMDRLAPFPFEQPEQELGRGWARAAAGDLPGGRDALLAAADQAAGLGYHSSEAWLLHDVARLGAPAAVVARLSQLARECEGSLVAAYAAHAGAGAAGRADALVDVTDRFEHIGATLLAAEAANEAAQAFRRAGDRRAAAAIGVRGTTLAASCEGARTPGLTALVMVVPLTQRERDIATYAAEGESSQEIADRLYLSVRTVNNHLQSVYSKLGVAGRRQLPGALAELGPDTEPPSG
jgi:ATP/maltotriose-dependent transcriptional regulator MalT